MKKESKAARAKRIYAEHGISYDMASGKIYAPILDKWIAPLLVNGNEKIGKGVYHFSTLAGTKEYHNAYQLYRTWWDGGQHRQRIAEYANFESVLYHLLEMRIPEFKLDYFPG